MSFLKRKFVRAVAVRFSGIFVMTLVAVVNSVLTARLLGPSGKGTYFLLYSTLTMIIAAGGVNLTFSQVYYRKHLKLSQIIGSSIVLSLIMGVLAAALGMLVVYMLRDTIYKEVSWDYLLISVGLVPMLLLATNIRSALEADYQIMSATITMATRPIVFMLVFGGLAISGWYTVGSAVTAMFISVIGMVAVGFVYVSRELSFSWSDFSLNKNGMLSYALKSHIGLLFKRMQDRFDIFIVAYFMTVADVGIYSVALAVSELAGKLSQVASMVLMGRIAKTNEEKKSIELTIRLNRIVFFLAALSIILLIFLASYIVNLAFGSEFSDAISAIIILLPGILAVGVFRILNTNLVTSGRPWLFSKISSAGIIVMIVGDFLLIPVYGINGAALASTIAYIISAVTMTIVVVRRNTYPLRDYFNVMPELKHLLELRKS